MALYGIDFPRRTRASSAGSLVAEASLQARPQLAVEDVEELSLALLLGDAGVALCRSVGAMGVDRHHQLVDAHDPGWPRVSKHRDLPASGRSQLQHGLELRLHAQRRPRGRPC